MKKIMLFVMSLPIALGGLASCTEVKVDAKQLEGKWNIVEVKGEKVEKEKMPFIEFNMAENRVYGNAGCNRFNSAIKLDSKNKSAITMSPAVSTMMACPDMEMEGKIMNTFENIKCVKADKDKNRLVLVDDSGSSLLVLSK